MWPVAVALMMLAQPDDARGHLGVAVTGGIRFAWRPQGIDVLPMTAAYLDAGWAPLRFLRLTAIAEAAMMGQVPYGLTGSNFSLVAGAEGIVSVGSRLRLSAGVFSGGAIAHVNYRCAGGGCTSDSSWKPAPTLAMRAGAEVWLLDRLSVGPTLTARWIPLDRYIDVLELRIDPDVSWLELALRVSFAL